MTTETIKWFTWAEMRPNYKDAIWFLEKHGMIFAGVVGRSSVLPYGNDRLPFSEIKFWAYPAFPKEITERPLQRQDSIGV